LAKQDDTPRRELRDLLVMLRDALGQPPLSAKMRLCVEGVMDLLGEQDVAKRLASRDRLDAMVAELDGRLQ
jgi:Mg2+/Co2+ transporter CorC